MANPRKFSEKIAMHNQKQAEETARFEQIMKEVSDATSKVNTLGRQHLRINPALGSFRGGSLPNVNHVANNTVENKTDLPNALSNFEELNKSGRADAQVVYRERGRNEGVGPMRSRPAEKRIDTSPYGGGSYLSPPPDTNWRRTNSDSALHQSTQDVGQRRQHHDHQIVGFHVNEKSEQRPRSFYEGSLVPGINILPSHNDPGSIQIPIGNNTGSLPDLTSVNFKSPLPTPLDQEDLSSSFSTSPQGASPSTLSPTSLPSRSQHVGRFPFGGSSPQESRVPSPHSNVHSQTPNQQIHSPSQRRRFYAQQPVQGLTIATHSPGGSHSPGQTSPLQNHLAVPSVISSYLHQTKGVTQDNSNNVSVNNFTTQDFIFTRSPVSSPHVNCSLPPQPDISQQPQISSLNSYRSQQPNRPSPQSSPGLTIQQYRSTSPGDSHNSAPQSPASPAGSPSANQFSDASYLLGAQATALQEHFEQFNMIDTPSSGSITYIASPNCTTSQVMSPDDGVHEIANDAGYFSTSPSQLQYTRPTGGSSTQQTTPQTPNTPSSIPDIVLTDFSSNAADELAKPEFVKDLGSAMSGSFDSDLFPSDETLREGLGQIDFDGFQMLTDPDMNVITDPTAEEHFRNPVREIYRRETRHHPNKICAYPQGNPIRLDTNIFDKLRNADAGQQPNSQDPNRGNDQGGKRGEFVSDDPKYLLQDTSSYQQAIKSLQQILKGVQPEQTNSPGNADVYKGNANKEQQDFRTKNLRWKKFAGSGRKKRLGRFSGSEKGYLDYTNSQMPFNEGTRRSLKDDEKGSESKDNGESDKGSESNYSRVRRFLDRERMRKLAKGSTTLEAKEAAMSRVLDPNLNLDGVLEPHIRKRRYSCGRGTRWNSLA